MATLYVHPTGFRPDSRLILAFIWGDAEGCDTCGNARHPADREWTELYARNRSRPDEVFNVAAARDEPLVLAVESPVEWLAAAVALLLAGSSCGEVSSEPYGPSSPASSVVPRAGQFDARAAWDRYRSSPFQRATAGHPYPNLDA